MGEFFLTSFVKFGKEKIQELAVLLLTFCAGGFHSYQGQRYRIYGHFLHRHNAMLGS